jgi:O-antigen ligase
MKKLFLISIITILGLSVLGELVRLGVGPENGILPNDLLVAAVVGVWLIQKTVIERKWPKSVLWAPFLTFVAIAFVSLLNGSREITTKETIISGLYLVRFIEYFLLTFIVLDLARTKKNRQILLHSVLIGGTLVAIAGFIQLQIQPDFGSFEELGWDPHKGRLLSTWFDPNFVGGLFAFMLAIITSFMISKTTKPKKKIKLTVIGLIILYALLLTFSRSAYLAFLAGVGVIGLFKSRQLIIGLIIASILLVSVSARAQERVVNLYHTAQSLVGIGAELPDATARLRLDSWRGARTIIEDKPLLGIGFNTYAYAQNRYGFLDDLKKHSATGSDSTLLTIWATTGTLGFLAYLWLLGTILWTTFMNRQDPLSLGIFAGLIGLLVHSIFVNSLLFTPLLVFVYISLGLTLNTKKK